MSDIHIDDFYRDTARILVALYNQFPRKTTLYVEDVAGPDKPDEFGLHSPRHLACLHTILWLAQSDYVRYETLIRQEAVDQIVLSHKGFLLLTSLTPSFTRAQPVTPLAKQDYVLVNCIRRELKEGTSFSLAELMRQTLLDSRNFGN